MFPILAGQRRHGVAEPAEATHGQAADAAGRAGHNHRARRRRQPVVLEFDDRERGGKAGGADRHRLEGIEALRQRHDPVGRHTSCRRVAAVVRDAEVVPGHDDRLPRPKPRVGGRPDGAGEIDPADEREPAQDFRRSGSRQRVLVIDAGVGDVDHDVAWRELVEHGVDDAAGAFVVGDAKRAERHRASGSGRIWKCITLLGVPFPPSMWNGARVDTVAHTPRPFHPPFGSSMRPSIHFCRSRAGTARASRPTCRP